MDLHNHPNTCGFSKTEHCKPHMVQKSHSDSTEITKLTSEWLHLKITMSQQLSSLIFSLLISLGSLTYCITLWKVLFPWPAGSSPAFLTGPGITQQEAHHSPLWGTSKPPEIAQRASHLSLRGGRNITPLGAKASPGFIGRTQFITCCPGKWWSHHPWRSSRKE